MIKSSVTDPDPVGSVSLGSLWSLMSRYLNLLQKKIEKKKIGICSILGRIRIQNRTRIRYPESGSADPDLNPHQNKADQKH